ncbi:MAG TPA: SDR family NAD(P)-dependent oxidoreductase [Atribacteraceae bacterium]|nr:SDR family NAD(P)-dependent oxidoreductase [Atribacteraceae bacterium]
MAKKIHTYPVDGTSPRELAAIYRTIESEHEPIDVLVNNAGIYQGINFWEQDLEIISRIIDVNLKGTLFATCLVLPSMIARKQGRIINISSVSGTRGIHKEVTYGASKHGMIGMADALAQEVRSHGI